MEDDEVAAILGGSSQLNAGPSRAPCPARGANREFDRYFDEATEEIDPGEADMDELRRAAWATWKTKPPAALAGDSVSAQEDDELARVLALSAQEHQTHVSRQSSVRPLDNESDDEDLRKALALSHEEARAPKRQKRDDTPEEERRMLAEAMAASLAEGGPSTSSASSCRPPAVGRSQSTLPIPTSTVPSATSSPAPSDLSATPSVLRLGGQMIDRAQLEKERRERQAAREAQSNGSNPSQQPAGAVPSAGPARFNGMSSIGVPSSSTASSSSGAASTSKSSGGNSNTAQKALSAGVSHPFQASGPFPSDAAGQYYLEGEMRHTALTIGNPTMDRTFSPKQIVGKHSEISLIIMSSFVIDDQWIGDQAILPPPEVVPTIVVRSHLRDKPEHNGKIELQVNGELWVYPKMVGGWGSAHMKYFWIFYKTGRLRAVISTANMVPYDWEWIENTVFVQDFLPSPKPTPFREGHLPHDFPQQFRNLFVHTRVHTAIRHLTANHPNGSRIPFKPDDGFADMTKYDWSRVKVRIVMSVPGTYSGNDKVDEYGVCRLGKVLSEEGWVPKGGEKVAAEFQGSSLGQYSLDWFDKFYQFCSGKTARALAGRPKPSAWPSIKILFPTLATVDASALGRGGGGTMFAGKAFNKVTQPLFHDANSKRGGVLMHAKMLIAIFEPEGRHLGFEASPSKNGRRKASEIEDGDEGVGGWIYVGSHNFSPAAWGTVDLKKSPPVLSVKNYEIGIVFPLDRRNARATADLIAPYKRPARKYSAGDVPWDQNAHMPLE
ncbi:hypothetical protein IAR55_002801 [Kwoniella newhampshirensis]|uniref:Tyrosyl-DNA phosphodiesterase 1 n=1 Tax=Kwoniella newhampshirensis TaxID=1651941 RepID=A0AAW0Z024_9TREE